MKSTSLRKDYKFSPIVCNGLYYSNIGEPSKDDETGEVKFIRHYVFSEDVVGTVALHVPPEAENALKELPPWTPVKLVDGDFKIFASDGSSANNEYLTKYFTCSNFVDASGGASAPASNSATNKPPVTNVNRDFKADKPMDKSGKPEDGANK